MRRTWITHPRLGTGVIAIVAFCASLLVANWPLWTAPEPRFPGDLGDTRFIHYLLEHSWLWVARNPLHPLWSPPFYFPAQDTGAYSDIMVGLGVLYWPWRLMGTGPAMALSLWILACHALNFAAAWLILRRLLRFSPLATAAGALLFTLGSPRLNQLNHLQFLPQFFVLMSLAGAIMLFQEPATERRAWLAVALTYSGIVLQLWSAYYYGWFLIFIYVLAGIWMTLVPSLRAAMIAMLRRHARQLGVGALISMLAMIPWAQHYLAAAKLNPNESFEDIVGWVPRYQSWFYMGPQNWLYGHLMSPERFAAIPGWSNHEHRLGIGILTLLVAGIGLLSRIRNSWVLLTVLVSATLVISSTLLPGDVAIWSLIFDWVPGASAVRTVTRIELMLLIPASLGIALSIEWLVRHRQTVIPIALMGLVVLEQGSDYSTWRQQMGPQRAEAIADHIPADCRSFYYSPEANGPNTPDYPAWMYQIDAMWAGLYAEIPTVNAYGHNVPPGWDLAEPAIRMPGDADRITAALAAWQTLHPDAAPICHVRIPVP
ncbi:MAG TPA: hypothetical protein VNZ58_10360 [Thermomicrobiales bacterium]|nr:hypothetical protein [Thermomicrobiales bacterium]